MELYADNKFAIICVTEQMMNETQTTKQDTEGFVVYPLSIEGVKACIMFREDQGKVKLSLRSKSEVDVNKWARNFDGGGHRKAAGGWHPGPLEKAIEEVIEKGKEQL